MPTARELLEQAEALMRRNRAVAIDTEVPELTDVVPAVVAPPPAPASLDDIPELTDIVEEIEIASIAELPEDVGAASEWLHVERDLSIAAGQPGPVPARAAHALARDEAPPEDAPEASVVATAAADETVGTLVIDETFEPEPSAAVAVAVPEQHAPVEEGTAAPVAEVLEPRALVAEGVTPPIGEALEQPAPAMEGIAPPVEEVLEPPAPAVEGIAPPVEEVVEQRAPVADGPAGDAPSMEGARGLVGGPEAGAAAATALLSAETAAGEVTATSAEGEPAVGDDDWARWQALAEEIRMQVLQRIDMFTDTALREQLGAQLQPIVDRASAEMIATVNREVGTLLRAYIAEAIEREIDKWRKGNT